MPSVSDGRIYTVKYRNSLAVYKPYPDPINLLGSTTLLEKSNHNTIKVAIVLGIPLTCQNFLVDLFDTKGELKSLGIII